VFTRLLFATLPGVGSLWVARALSLLGLFLFAVVLLRALTPLLRSRARAVLTVLLICALPPFQVYVAWATVFCVPYSAALAGAAALLAERASDPTRRDHVLWGLLGGVLLLLALAMYQPTAMAYWLVTLIVALGRRHSIASLSAFLRSAVLVGVPPMVGAYLMLKIGVWTLGAADTQRSGLVSDIPAKLHWIPQPLGLALNLFNMPQSAAVAAMFACLVIAGTLLFCRDCSGRARVLVLSVAALSVPLSFAPNLLSQENYATFRTVGPLTAVFALLFALLFVSLERERYPAWLRAVARGALAAVAAVSVLLGFVHMRTLIAQPQSREWRRVLAEVDRLPRNATAVSFLAPTFDEGPIRVEYGVRDEFGVPTSASTWADPSLVWLARREAGLPAPRSFTVRVTVGSSAAAQGLPVVDMRRLQQLR
jgi:hypothetical protein